MFWGNMGIYPSFKSSLNSWLTEIKDNSYKMNFETPTILKISSGANPRRPFRRLS